MATQPALQRVYPEASHLLTQCSTHNSKQGVAIRFEVKTPTKHDFHTRKTSGSLTKAEEG